ncbi:hypothetical protein BS47DRAFT_1362469 [Hydnum rufescens UP504]|uniref:Uncharacterized protein n=1 Tax=Hydnum rufescens UP504 TaxID=1448309 RepID=A0A9P6DW51_9AGAM|nr:hypothetical protein BS47DRAFT_1362469 [Hydnum rufescens UP504]
MTNQTWHHTPTSAECPDSTHRKIQEHAVAQDPNSRLSATHVMTKQVQHHTPALAGSPSIPYPKKIDEARDEYNITTHPLQQVSSLCMKPHPKPAWTRPKAKYRHTQPSKTAAPKHPQCTQQVRYSATPAPAGLWYTIGSPFTVQNPNERNQMPKVPVPKFPTNTATNEIEHHTPAKVGPLHYTKAMKLKAKYGCVLSMHETPLNLNTAEIQDKTWMCTATHNPIQTPLSKPVRTPPNNPTATHANAQAVHDKGGSHHATHPLQSPLREDMPNEGKHNPHQIPIRQRIKDGATCPLQQGPPLCDTPPEEYTDKVQGKIQEHAANQTPTPKYNGHGNIMASYSTPLEVPLGQAGQALVLSPDMKTHQTNPPPTRRHDNAPAKQNHKYDWPKNTHQTKPGNGNTQHKTTEPPDKPHPLRRVCDNLKVVI